MDSQVYEDDFQLLPATKEVKTGKENDNYMLKFGILRNFALS